MGWPFVGLLRGTVAEIADAESSTQDRLLYVLVLCGLVLGVLAALLPIVLLVVVWMGAPEAAIALVLIFLLAAVAAAHGRAGRVLMWGTGYPRARRSWWGRRRR
jgi:hypothetical protein